MTVEVSTSILGLKRSPSRTLEPNEDYIAQETRLHPNMRIIQVIIGTEKGGLTQRQNQIRNLLPNGDWSEWETISDLSYNPLYPLTLGDHVFGFIKRHHLRVT